VVDLSESLNGDKNAFLALGKGIEINNPLTLCLRFNVQSALMTNYIFTSTDEKLVLILRFKVSLGIVLINGIALGFEIPKDNAVKPFHWHHICVSSSEDSYTIIFDGQQWYHANHTLGSFKKTTLKRLDLGVLGSTNEYWVWSDSVNFRGLLSELNIWSKSLSIIQMIKITRNCGKVDTIPDLLNWSELPSSMIEGSKYSENIGNICPFRNETTSPTYKIMPYIHDQDIARDVCKILNGELAFPTSKNEFRTWNGNLLKIKFRKLNNNFSFFP
jgi:hypothetical protein